MLAGNRFVVRRKTFAFPDADPTTWFDARSFKAIRRWLLRLEVAGRIRDCSHTVKAGFRRFFDHFRKEIHRTGTTLARSFPGAL